MHTYCPVPFAALLLLLLTGRRSVHEGYYAHGRSSILHDLLHQCQVVLLASAATLPNAAIATLVTLTDENCRPTTKAAVQKPDVAKFGCTPAPDVGNIMLARINCVHNSLRGPHGVHTRLSPIICTSVNDTAIRDEPLREKTAYDADEDGLLPRWLRCGQTDRQRSAQSVSGCSSFDGTNSSLPRRDN